MMSAVPKTSARRDRRRSLRSIFSSVNPAQRSGALLDDDFQACLLQRRNGRGDQRDPGFAGRGFTWNADLHADRV